MKNGVIVDLAMTSALLTHGAVPGTDDTKYLAERPAACGLLDERLASARLCAHVDRSEKATSERVRAAPGVTEQLRGRAWRVSQKPDQCLWERACPRTTA